MRLAVGAAVGLALATLPANAGPDATTNYFSETPATLLDFGIYKLSFFIQRDIGNGFANYSWDEDKILIQFIEFSKDSGSEACIKRIEETREMAGIKDGKPTYKHSSFANFFTHSGFIRGTQEAHDKRLTELDKKFRIICYSLDGDFSADLLGTNHSVTKNAD